MPLDLLGAGLVRPQDLRLLGAGLAVGIVLAWIARRERHPSPVALLLAGAVAALAATGRLTDPGLTLVRLAWFAGTALVLVGGLTVLRSEPRLRPVTLDLAIGATAAGMWMAIPETGPLLVVIGIAAPLVANRRALPEPSAGVRTTAVILLAWASAAGAGGRGTAAAGAVACGGFLAWWPAGWPARRWLALRRPTRWADPAWLVVHSVLVLGAARWVAVAGDGSWARLAWLAVAGAAASALWPRPPPRDQASTID